MRQKKILFLTAIVLAIFIFGCVGTFRQEPLMKTKQKSVVWDESSLVLVAESGSYGRMIKLPGEKILCSFERHGKSFATISDDGGRTWGEPVLAATFQHGSAANPEVVLLNDGSLMMMVNERPGDGVHPFAIRTHISRDLGKTWNVQSLAYEAGTDFHSGCWEPAGLQLPSGEIQIFFANEKPYPDSHEQEITMVRSLDQGCTWSEGARVAFVPSARDGMPVPLLLNDGENIVVAIEDNRPGRTLQPSIIASSVEDNWNQPTVGLQSPLRWQPLSEPLPPDTYAGAPYICQMPDGTTLLSCQIGKGPEDCTMAVFVGDRNARNFTSRTTPFPVDEGHSALWNSLFCKNQKTVTAISGTAIDGVWGVWAIDGKLR